MVFMIKFRAWDKRHRYKEAHCMIDWAEILNNADEVFNDNEFYELMQYTGLTDRHGKEIYDNDVFKLVDRYDNEHHFKVEFENFSYIGTLIKSESSPVFTVVQYAFGEYDHVDYEIHGESELLSVIEQFLESGTIEVIGNLYENPELLK